jgi:ketosteroid isomerase-like protein
MPPADGERVTRATPGMDDPERVRRLAGAIADAIAQKDGDRMAAFLASGFVHRSPGGSNQDAVAFVQAIRAIPVEILFVRLVALEIDVVSESGALATGIQHARVRIDGADVDDRRAFVDWFVKVEDEWRLRVAVDLPAPEEPDASASACRS